MTDGPLVLIYFVGSLLIMSSYSEGVFNGKKLFRTAVKFNTHWNHFTQLSVCEFLHVVPKGLVINKTACIGDASENFHLRWLEIEHDSALQLVSALKEEHFRIARELEMQFWTSLPETLSSTDGTTTKCWLEGIVKRLKEDTRKWINVQHKKIRKLAPNYIEACKNFSINERYSFEEDILHVADAFRPNFRHVTDNRRQRKKRKSNIVDSVYNDFNNSSFNDFLGFNNFIEQDSNILCIKDTGYESGEGRGERERFLMLQRGSPGPLIIF